MYLITMYRWGDTTDDSYVLGCFMDEQEAKEIGVWQMDYRGHKYEPYITEVEDCPIVIELDRVDTWLKDHIYRMTKVSPDETKKWLEIQTKVLITN